MPTIFPTWVLPVNDSRFTRSSFAMAVLQKRVTAGWFHGEAKTLKIYILKKKEEEKKNRLNVIEWGTFLNTAMSSKRNVQPWSPVLRVEKARDNVTFLRYCFRPTLLVPLWVGSNQLVDFISAMVLSNYTVWSIYTAGVFTASRPHPHPTSAPPHVREQMAPGRLLCSSTSATILVNSKRQSWSMLNYMPQKHWPTPLTPTEERSLMGEVAQPMKMWLPFCKQLFHLAN